MRKLLSQYSLPVDLKFGDAGEIIGYIKRTNYNPDRRKLDEMVAKTKGVSNAKDIFAGDDVPF